MMVHFLDPDNTISIVGFIDTFKLACDTDNIHEGAELLVLLFFVEITLATSLNSCMSAAAHINPAVA